MTNDKSSALLRTVRDLLRVQKPDPQAEAGRGEPQQLRYPIYQQRGILTMSAVSFCQWPMTVTFCGQFQSHYVISGGQPVLAANNPIQFTQPVHAPAPPPPPHHFRSW